MIILDAATKTLEAVLGGAVVANQPVYNVSYVDVGVNKYTPGHSNGLFNSATPVTMVAAPSNGVQRQIKHATIYNKDTGSVTVTVRMDTSATDREMVSIVLAPGSTLEYVDTAGWRVITSAGVFLTGNTSAKDSIRFTINQGAIGDAGSLITVGVAGYLRVPFACTITGVTLLADQAGSLVVDIWKDTYGNYPPTVADTITAAAKPTLTAAQKSQDTTLTGWITAVAEGDILAFNVDSVATLLSAVLELHVTRT